MCSSTVKRIVLASAALFVISIQIQHGNGANILGLFTSHSPSHLLVHMSVVKALAEKGHNVTVVSSLEPKITHKNIRHIVIPPTEIEKQLISAQVSNMTDKKTGLFQMFIHILNGLGAMISGQFNALKDERFTTLYNTPDTKFDLVIMGYFMNDFQLGVAAKFNCPVIVEWTSNPMLIVNTLVGNPEEVAYVPDMNIGIKIGEKMGFYLRLKNFLSHLFYRLLNIIISRRMEGYYSELFPYENFPTYEEMRKNVSLVFCNSHFSEGPIRPNVPALVEIGGIQIKEKPNPLPKDIHEFLEASKQDGAIFFSLGSNVQGSSVKQETVQIIYNTFASLKQNVIWKWEDEKNKPGNATNILYKSWLPQDDILAHRNIKLFITHAGKGGLAEAQYHGIPMVALPIFAEQPGNAEKMVAAGYGQQLDIHTLTEDNFRNTIKEVLSNPKYAQNVQEFSKLYRDRPLTAKESVVYWTEYVIRHHGAAHLQSPLIHLNAIQSTNLDVIVFLLFIIYTIWRIFKFVIKFIFSLLKRKAMKIGSRDTPSKVKKQ